MGEEDEVIPLVEGEEAPPEIAITPVDSEDVVDDDKLMGANLPDLPEESFEADPEDTKGIGGLCG